MALRLTVVSEQRGPLGRNASIVLGVGGGSIGRAHDNDWVLPDAQCYVSAHHARVQYRSGSYYLLDTSTNGTYVNGSSAPISPRNIYPLRDGDNLRVGEYEIAVRIDVETGEAPEASSIFAIGGVGAANGSGDSDIGVELDVQGLLQTGANLEARLRASDAVDVYGQTIAPGNAGLQALARATVVGVQRARRQEATGSHRALSSPGPEPSGTAEAFFRGAGVDPGRVPLEVQTQVLKLAGLLLREALMGMKGLALAQRELRDQARLPVGREDTQHIGLTGLPVEELLLRLLLGHQRRELDAVQWMRELAANARAYDQALMRALPPALADFIARLDPRVLSHQPAASDAELGQPATGVTARFRSITDRGAGSMPQLFCEALSRAFGVEFARGPHDQGRP
ncbi:MAG TPA: type VI secretion system-associated FHA domain protein TagH [Steroidobacteraceae bacterium]|nr:type VI secretion system-associated FHA domain protein TagH [Steroidobacteraceae bacterium]